MAKSPKRKCHTCKKKYPLPEMHLLKLEVQTRPWLPSLVLRNFAKLLLGSKPEHVSRKSWLFGHYKRLESKKVTRWSCFNCYIKVLTPKEYELFRNGYYDDAIIEDGHEKAAQLVANLDAVFAAHKRAR